MCGDALTDDLNILLDVPVDVVFADPPYGVGLDPKFDAMHSSPDHHKTGDRFASVIGDDGPFDAGPLIALLSDVREQFWWGADYYRSTIEPGGSWVIWDKRWDEGMEDRLDAVLGSQFEMCWSRQSHRREIARVLWSGHHGMQGEDTRIRLHPTQKPVALALWFFERWVPPGSVVLDPFLGSGTTLIAAHQHGAIVRACEVSPAYVDVALARWQRLTGEKPILEATGEPHDFLAGDLDT